MPDAAEQDVQLPQNGARQTASACADARLARSSASKASDAEGNERGV